jgi:hypothetical protein
MLHPCYLWSTCTSAIALLRASPQAISCALIIISHMVHLRPEHEAGRTLMRQCNSSLLPQPTDLHSYPSLNPHMSNTRTTSTSSSNFQLIFNNALKAYERRTKNDLLAHPLAAQLQDCDSHASILNILQQQVQELNRSQSSDERLTKWLDPTVKVLYTLSETLGEGVSLVCLMISKVRDLHSHTCFTGILSRESDLCRNRCPSFSVYPS